ncbi:hypothetical protein Tco_0951105 [Tanacetum coccineum]|uniref:DUF4218 domain-containing protein n=1 Tax=Tanacetum coccineum TaxID=301880 RepID=A0ABQ5DT69_9ASTR
MAVKSKIVYVGHRRFLRTKHPLRSKFKEFYGLPELKHKPRKFTETDIQLQISKVFKRFPGKHPDIAKKNPKPNRNIELNWSKRSIFWDLEYWPFLLLKNNLDVMHIEKNALEALLNNLLQNDKSKDTLKARWMFPFERYMKKLKNYVRNKAKPEGSIAEGYVAEEALTFCSRYLKDDVETRLNHLGRNDDGLPEEKPDKLELFRSVCKPTGRMKETRLTTDVMQAVVWFVLNNSPEVDADILAYREESPDNVETTRKSSYGDVDDADHMTQIVRQQEQEKELYRKQAEEAQARAYLASLKADTAHQRANVAYQNTESIYGALDLAREKNNECSSGEEEEDGEQQSGDDYSSEEEE